MMDGEKTAGNGIIPVERLSDDGRRLAALAAGILENAYAPYSGYYVGAAILAVSGRIYTGVNCENASFGATVCAERAALTAAVTAGERAFTAIAVAAKRAGADADVSPCGLCRQMLREFGDMTVIAVLPGGVAKVTALSALLPDSFKGDSFAEYETR